MCQARVTDYYSASVQSQRRTPRNVVGHVYVVHTKDGASDKLSKLSARNQLSNDLFSIRTLSFPAAAARRVERPLAVLLRLRWVYDGRPLDLPFLVLGAGNDYFGLE